MKKAFEPGKVPWKRAGSEHGTVEAMQVTPMGRTPDELRAEQGRLSVGEPILPPVTAARL